MQSYNPPVSLSLWHPNASDDPTLAIMTRTTNAMYLQIITILLTAGWAHVQCLHHPVLVQRQLFLMADISGPGVSQQVPEAARGDFYGVAVVDVVSFQGRRGLK
jgi:hypothetical protein